MRDDDDIGSILAPTWDTLNKADWDRSARGPYPIARLCPLCGAWVWSEEKHREWHLADAQTAKASQ